MSFRIRWWWSSSGYQQSLRTRGLYHLHSVEVHQPRHYWRPPPVTAGKVVSATVMLPQNHAVSRIAGQRAFNNSHVRAFSGRE
jgi:hypothetical protein